MTQSITFIKRIDKEKSTIIIVVIVIIIITIIKEECSSIFYLNPISEIWVRTRHKVSNFSEHLSRKQILANTSKKCVDTNVHGWIRNWISLRQLKWEIEMKMYKEIERNKGNKNNLSI